MKGIFSISKSILEPGVSRKIPTYEHHKNIVVHCMKLTSSNKQIVNDIKKCCGFEKTYDIFYKEIEPDFKNLKLSNKNCQQYTDSVSWLAFSKSF